MQVAASRSSSALAAAARRIAPSWEAGLAAFQWGTTPEGLGKGVLRPFAYGKKRLTSPVCPHHLPLLSSLATRSHYLPSLLALVVNPCYLLSLLALASWPLYPTCYLASLLALSTSPCYYLSWLLAHVRYLGSFSSIETARAALDVFFAQALMDVEAAEKAAVRLADDAALADQGDVVVTSMAGSGWMADGRLAPVYCGRPVYLGIYTVEDDARRALNKFHMAKASNDELSVAQCAKECREFAKECKLRRLEGATYAKGGGEAAAEAASSASASPFAGQDTSFNDTGAEELYTIWQSATPMPGLVLGDDAGSGKTNTVSRFVRLLMQRGQVGLRAQVLVVVPTKLVSQWAHEVRG